MFKSSFANKTNQVIKKSILLVEQDTGLLRELSRSLEPFYEFSTSSSTDEANAKLKNGSVFNVILTNANLHPEDHSLMDGFSIARVCQFLDHPIPVIVYTDVLHPLAAIEARRCGTFKILDQTRPDFKSCLLKAVNFAIKIGDWKSQFEASKKNAIHVRKILQEIPHSKLKGIPHITPIQWNYSDENLYNCFFCFFLTQTHDPFCYANNWAYICQAARNNGHKFFNGRCLITIATESIDNFEFTIINPLGQSAAKRSLELAEQLKRISAHSVIIKRVSKTHEKYFLNSGKCSIFHKPKSKRLEDQYDDIYPQVVVNLKAFMKHLTSDRLLNFQRNLRKFSSRNYTMKTITPELFDDFWDVVLKWKRSFIRRYERHGEFTDIPQNDDYYINPYFPIFEYYSKYVDNRTTLSSLVYVDNIPVGFSFLSRISKICMGMYANIADTDYEGLAEFMLYQNLTKAYWSGYKFVNLGGTESRYLYDFYKRLKLSSGNSESFEIETNYLIYE